MNANQGTFTCLASSNGIECNHTQFVGDSWQAMKFAESLAKRAGITFKPVVRGDGWQWIVR